MTDAEQPDWTQIVADHAERVFRIAVRILGSVHDAEDVAQDVFVEAFELYQTKGVRSWAGLLVRLASLRAIDRLRRREPTEVLAENPQSGNAGPEEESAAAELAEWLRTAVGRLPDQQGEVFTLACFEHLSRDEIAASLGITPQAVSTALHKARQRLLSQLSVCYGDSR